MRKRGEGEGECLKVDAQIMSISFICTHSPESMVPLVRGFYVSSSTTPHSPPQEFSRQHLCQFFHILKGMQ